MTTGFINYITGLSGIAAWVDRERTIYYYKFTKGGILCDHYTSGAEITPTAAML